MAVYVAVEVESGRRVAIRLLAGWVHGTMARYFVETRAAIEVHHANIVDILDFGRDTVGKGDSVGYVVMGYLHGESLLTGRPFDARVDIYALGLLMYRLDAALLGARAQGFRRSRREGPGKLLQLRGGSALPRLSSPGACIN